MTNLTRGQVRTLIRQSLSDEASEKWSDTALDFLTQVVYDELWTRILHKNPYFVRQVDIVTPVAPGYVDLKLVADGGSLTQRFHRLQEVFRGASGSPTSGRVYRELDPRDVLLQGNPASVIWTPDFRYTFLGDQLWLFQPNGLDATTAIEVRYSYLPTVYTGLADTAQISWPTGMEGVLVNAVCSRAESNDPQLRQAFQERFTESFVDMLEILKRSHFMKVGWSPDSTESWGGI